MTQPRRRCSDSKESEASSEPERLIPVNCICIQVIKKQKKKPLKRKSKQCQPNKSCWRAKFSFWAWKLYFWLGRFPGTQPTHADPHVTAVPWDEDSSTLKSGWLYS